VDFDPALLHSTLESMAEGVIVYDNSSRVLLVNERALDLLALTEAQVKGEDAIDDTWRPIAADGTPLRFRDLPVPTTLRTGLPLTNSLMGVRHGDEVVWLSTNSELIRTAAGEQQGVVATFRDATDVKVGRDIDRGTRELAWRLVEAPLGYVDEVIDAHLATLGDVSGADRVLWVEIDRDRGIVRMTHDWSNGLAPVVRNPDGLPVDLFARMLGRLGRREIVTVVERAQIPPDRPAIDDRMTVWGLESAVAAPVLRADQLCGFLVIGWVRPFEPHQRLLDFFGVAGELLAARFERETAHGELQQLNTSLDERVSDRSRHLAEANAALERALQARDDFLASVSHELRTPLNAILGLTEMLLDDESLPLDGPQRSSIETIDASGQKLLGFINDLLDLSRLNAESATLDRGEVDVADVGRQVVDQVRERAVTKGLRLEFVDGTGRVTMALDEARLRQILLLLLDNAVKFTDPGGSVGLQIWRPDDASIAFSVWDTGIGIAPDEQATMFEPFARVEGGMSRRHAGSGLGLALVDRLVALHGGRMELDSELGRGSRFTAVLPHPETG
jgi:PAS domain S-box-containing protein